MHEHEREPDTIADSEPAPTLPLPSASADELILARCATQPDAPAVGDARHRWSYAQTATPLGQPYVKAGPIYAGGDWTIGATAQQAWQSGHEIANAILSGSAVSRHRP